MESRGERVDVGPSTLVLVLINGRNNTSFVTKWTCSMYPGGYDYLI